MAYGNAMAQKRLPLTGRQKVAIKAIRKFVRKEGREPTKAELGAAIGMKSQNVTALVRELERKGWVEHIEPEIRADYRLLPEDD